MWTGPAAGDNGPVSASVPFRVCVVCSGNICRSPIGEQVLRAAVAEAGLDGRVVVDSAGTGPWHVGQGAHHGTVRVLADAGLPTDHVARQIGRRDLDGIDLVLGADHGHVRELRRISAHPERIHLLRSFDPDAETDEVPDPYYGPDAGFDEVLAMTRAAAPGVVAEIRRRLGATAGDERR